MTDKLIISGGEFRKGSASTAYPEGKVPLGAPPTFKIADFNQWIGDLELPNPWVLIPQHYTRHYAA